jgi:hypothetical protein
MATPRAAAMGYQLLRHRRRSARTTARTTRSNNTLEQHAGTKRAAAWGFVEREARTWVLAHEEKDPQRSIGLRKNNPDACKPKRSQL